MLERLGRVEGSILGVVLNKIPRDSHFYGGYYHNYYSNKKGDYYYQEEEENQPQLQADRHLMKLLPQAVSQPVEYLSAQQFDSPENFNSVFDVQRQVAEVESPFESPENFESVFESRKPVEVESPPQVIPASIDIITKPRKRNEGLRSTEEPSYVIKKTQLEYWVDDDEDEGEINGR